MKVLASLVILLALGQAQAAEVQSTTLRPTFVQCWVVGQDPTNENQYNQLLKYIPELDLSNNSALIFASENFAVSASVNAEGQIAVASIAMPGSRLMAYASGGSDSVSLIDATTKISVLCKQK